MSQVDINKIVKVKTEVEDEILKLPGVHGVSIGYKRVKDKQTDKLAIIIHLEKKLDLKDLKKEHIIKSHFQGIPTDVIAHSRLSLFAAGDDTNKYRPLRGGCQIATSSMTGALGTFVKDRTTGDIYLLSARHVLENNGSDVYQPNFPVNNKIATITNGFNNDTIDAAIAKIENTNWNNWIAEIGAIQGLYTLTTQDLLGYSVLKRGPVTGLTYGNVYGYAYTVAFIEGITKKNQYYINALVPKGVFGKHGDSGAIVVDDQHNAIGLFIGGDDTGYVAAATPIQYVLDQLNVDLIYTNMPPVHLVHCSGSDTYASEICSDDGLTWTDDTLIPNPDGAYGTGGTPSLVMFQEHLVCVRRSRSNFDMWYAFFDGNSWGADNHVDWITSQYRPGLAVYRGILYIIYPRGTRSTPWVLHYTTLSSINGQLAPEGVIPYPANGTPALIVFRGKLYCIREVGDSSNRRWLWCAYFDGNKWNDYQMKDENGTPIGGKVWIPGTPSVVFYNGRIYCFHSAPKDSENSGNFYNKLNINLYTSTDGLAWTTEAIIPLTSGGSPTAFVYNTALYVFRDIDSKIWCFIDNDNDNRDFMLINNGGQQNGYSTDGPPVAAMLPPNLPPTISSFTPTSGAVGTTVTINGTNFNSATNVQFNGLDAGTIEVVSYAQIKVNVPLDATTGNITVINPSGPVISTGIFFVL